MAVAISGTTVKFQARPDTDQAAKNGTNVSIPTLHQCITAMKEYETQSIEELRFDDYQAKRKFPQQAAFGSTLFGGTTTTAASATGSIFGSGGMTQSTSSSSGFLGGGTTTGIVE